MTELDSAGTNRTASNRGNIVAGLGVVIVLGLLTACAREQTLQPRTGDEPPIRVRNGSLEIELAWQTKEFEEDPSTAGTRKVWQIKQAGRERNRFTVVIVSSDQSCNGLVRTAAKVDVDYSDGQRIDFQAVGGSGNSRTKVTAHGDPLNKVSNQGLRHGAPHVPGQPEQFISEIRITGGSQSQTCTFSSRDANLQIFLLD